MADSFHTNTHRTNRHPGSGSILHVISDHSSVAEWNSSPSTGTDLRAGRLPPRQGNEAEEKDSGAAAATKTALQALVHPEPRDQSSALPVHTTGAGGAPASRGESGRYLVTGSRRPHDMSTVSRHIYSTCIGTATWQFEYLGKGFSCVWGEGGGGFRLAGWLECVRLGRSGETLER